jgi:hypothetical protein
MSAPQLNLETVGNLVRHWVHSDNAISEANKKLKEMRDTKEMYEQQILQLLKASSLKQPVIQIAGGRILVSEDKTSQPLSFTMLEGMLNNYYASRPGSRPETKEILKYIRENRTSQISPCLKRIMTQKSRADTKV